MAKSKKDIILELKKQEPDISAEKAADLAQCTLAYAKRILTQTAAKYNSDICELGRKIGITDEEMDDWYDWLVKSLSNPRAASCFRSTIEHKKYLEGNW